MSRRRAGGVVWVAWERHRRSIELCRWLGVEAVLFESSLPRWIKHPWLMARTVGALLRRRPKVLVVQNPSLVLTAVASSLRRPLGYRLVVDAHNAAVRPEGALLRRMTPLIRRAHRRAHLTIVTNDALAEDVRANGGRPFVLPDRLPVVPEGGRRALRGDHAVACILNYESDEPLDAIFEAAKGVEDGVVLHLTGNHRKYFADRTPPGEPALQFTGFLDDPDYWELLRSADVVMDLTTREDCLVCGAYEAIAAGRPLILSDTRALRDYFSRGVVYTRNDPASIRAAIADALSRRDELAVEGARLREELVRSWEERGRRLAHYLDAPGPTPESPSTVPLEEREGLSR